MLLDLLVCQALPTWPWARPTAQLTLLLAVEAVEVALAAAVDEGPALGDSLVVVPPQGVALAVPLVQRQPAGLSCGENAAAEGWQGLAAHWRWRLPDPLGKGGESPEGEG